MRKFPIYAMCALFPAFALTLLVGCPSPPKTNPTTTVAQTEPTKSEPPAKTEALKVATTGKITGKVTLDGDAPMMDPTVDPKNADKDFCNMGKEFEKRAQKWIVDDKKGVANVLIVLEAPKGKSFAITDEIKKPFLSPAVIDQPHCAFVPHVVAVLADVQPLVVKNSAKVAHNTKIPQAGPKNPEYNPVVKAGESFAVPKPFAKYGKAVRIECNMHPWMNAYMHIIEHPYFAVTKEDGSFEIDNVPIDTPLHVYMWHESMDNKKEVEAAKSFKAGGNELPLKISAK